MSRYDEEYKKVCPYCEVEFEAKRINQKFCRNKCKYTFNNRKRKEKSLEKHLQQEILDRNHNVLSILYQSSKGLGRRVSKEELVKRGFSFVFFTHYGKTENGKHIMNVYNFSLCAEGSGEYTIKKAA